MSDRLTALTRWLTDELKLEVQAVTPASADASFRRYFRVHRPQDSLIAMDAPPDKEDCRPFVAVARAFHAVGLNVPEIFEADLEQGFLLLGDLGERLYLDALDADSVERLYGDALGSLATLQACGPGAERLPVYDHGLLWREMELFRDWLLGTHLDLALGEGLRATLDETFQLLAENALEQPQVVVHRDYHSRNLMVLPRHNPGILDFQDAVVGALTYDLVSLLRDCYIAWPREQVEDWVLGYHELALHSGVLREEDEERFLRWFDLMGVQRHLKAAGIFARLRHRDGKSGYLKDIPRTLGYVADVSARYAELGELGRLLHSEVLPRL